MTSFLLSTPSRTVALVEAGGRRQALLGYAYGVGRGQLHHSGAFEPVLIGAEHEPVTAAKARKIDGEFVIAPGERGADDDG